MVGQVEQLLRQAITLVPIGLYTPIFAVTLSILDRNHTLQYVIHGACPVISGMLSRAHVRQTFVSLGLYHSTAPACTVIESGAPDPPPSPPPPPGVPPARVIVEAFITLDIDPRGANLLLTASDVFATVALEWASGRVSLLAEITGHHAEGASLSGLTVTEGSESIVIYLLDDASQVSWLLATIEAAGRRAMCDYPEIRNCDVTAKQPSPPALPPPARPPMPSCPSIPPPPFLPTAARARFLQQAMSAIPPAVPSQPTFPPSPPSTPMLYEQLVNLDASRTFVVAAGSDNASRAQSALASQLASHGSVQCSATAVLCPSAVVRSISLNSSVLTVLRADVHLTVLANHKDVANTVAAGLFETLADTSELDSSLSSRLGRNMSVSVSSMYAQFDHPDRGLVIITASLPPPPPEIGTLQAQIDGVAAVVNFAVAGVVVTTVGAATAGAAVGGTAGSAGAGGGGAGGGGAPAGLLTLAFGAQRFVSYGALSANLSTAQARVSDSIAWAQGDFGLQNNEQASGEAQRELSEDNGREFSDGPPSDADGDFGSGGIATAAPDCCSVAAGKMSRILVALGAVLSLLLAAQAIVHCMWKHRMNRFYYERKRNPQKAIAALLDEPSLRLSLSQPSNAASTGRPESAAGAQGRSSSSSNAMAESSLCASIRQSTRVRFKPFPSPFVFPGLPVVAVSLFCTGLVGNALAMIQCRRHRVLAIVILGAVVGYGVFALAVLLHFNRRYRALMWKPAAYPKEATEVIDPLYRLISKLRAHCCCSNSGRRVLVIDRPRGKFAKLPAETKEPARTERLLASPCTLVHANASDTLDAYGFALMARSGGGSLGGVMFEFITLWANILIAAIIGICLSLEQGVHTTTVQLTCVLCVQSSIAVYAWFCRPSADRVMNLLVGTQFALEASMTALLLAETLVPELTFDAGLIAFLLALVAMLAPVVQRFYDAVIVQISKITRREGFTYKGAFFACLGLVVFLPTMVARFMGLDLGLGGKVTEGAGDDINKLSTKAANEGLVQQLDGELAEVASNLFWVANLEAKQRRQKRDQAVVEAARLIQERWRRTKSYNEQQCTANVGAAPVPVMASTLNREAVHRVRNAGVRRALIRARAMFKRSSTTGDTEVSSRCTPSYRAGRSTAALGVEPDADAAAPGQAGITFEVSLTSTPTAAHRIDSSVPTTLSSRYTRSEVPLDPALWTETRWAGIWVRRSSTPSADPRPGYFWLEQNVQRLHEMDAADRMQEVDGV